MARRTTIGSVTGALVDSMAVVSDVATIVCESIDHLRVMNEGLGHKAVVFRDAAKIDAQVELGKMKTSKRLEAIADLAKAKAELKRLMDTDQEMAAAWDESKTEVDAWFE